MPARAARIAGPGRAGARQMAPDGGWPGADPGARPGLRGRQFQPGAGHGRRCVRRGHAFQRPTTHGHQLSAVPAFARARRVRHHADRRHLCLVALCGTGPGLCARGGRCHVRLREQRAARCLVGLGSGVRLGIHRSGDVVPGAAHGVLLRQLARPGQPLSDRQCGCAAGLSLPGRKLQGRRDQQRGPGAAQGTGRPDAGLCGQFRKRQ